MEEHQDEKEVEGHQEEEEGIRRRRSIRRNSISTRRRSKNRKGKGIRMRNNKDGKMRRNISRRETD